MFYRACTRIFPQADENVWVRGMELLVNHHYEQSYDKFPVVDLRKRLEKEACERELD